MPPRSGDTGFTLVELTVSIAVLVLLMVLVMELFNGATAVTTLSRKRIGADEAARVVFDRMGGDFARMIKRSDVDYIFYKQPGVGSGQPGNDAMYFYSEGPGYLDPAAALGTTGSTSGVALVGYRINQNNPYYPNTPVIERLGENLTWEGSPDVSGTNPGGMVFLPATLAGTWANVLGTPPYLSQDTEHYQVLSDLVFRMEFCFMVRSGTYVLSGTTFAGASTGYLNTPTAIPPSSVPVTSIPTTTNYFAGSSLPDLAGNVYGLPPDLGAIIVTIAVLDNTSRKVIPQTGNLNNLAGALSDSLSGSTAQGESGIQTNPQLTAQVWQSQLLSHGFAKTVNIPQTTLAQVRIYERTFYLNAN